MSFILSAGITTLFGAHRSPLADRTIYDFPDQVTTVRAARCDLGQCLTPRERTPKRMSPVSTLGGRNCRHNRSNQHNKSAFARRLRHNLCLRQSCGFAQAIRHSNLSSGCPKSRAWSFTKGRSTDASPSPQKALRSPEWTDSATRESKS